MWINASKLVATGLLAFAALVGLGTVWHDQPRAYPVTVRTARLSGSVRATLRHVDLAAWRTADHDVRGGDPVYWEGFGLDVYTQLLDRAGERSATDVMFATAASSARVGELGMAHGSAVPPIRSYSEVVVPTWLAVSAGVAPFVVVATRLTRRRRRALVGHCRRCGYDLRATPGRCPECGATPPSA